MQLQKNRPDDPIRSDVLVADLSQPSGVAAVVERSSGDASVSFLVKNAGFSVLKPLSKTPSELIEKPIRGLSD